MSGRQFCHLLHGTDDYSYIDQCYFAHDQIIEKMHNYNNFLYRVVVGDDLSSSFIDQSDGTIYDGYIRSLYSILPPDDPANQFFLMPNITPPIIVDYFPNHPLGLSQFEDLSIVVTGVSLISVINTKNRNLFVQKT
ncbi:hypothetical protein L6452_20985 [Arctium lappa]|uniref:Uncharacterized protein n=1 Tax=Arctium lappa TaxID=4217 RepID=A0ACB9BDP7_ARCLA|nr:hypothetical protein L6452_20985 [Arctium lappa]